MKKRGPPTTRQSEGHSRDGRGVRLRSPKSAQSVISKQVAKRRRSAGDLQLGSLRKRSSKRRLSPFRLPDRLSRRLLANGDGEGCSISELPSPLLQIVFDHVASTFNDARARSSCALVCRSWSAICKQSFVRTVKKGGSINAVIHRALPGDTIVIEPGLYHEKVLVSKPLKLEAASDGRGGGAACLGVVISTSRPPCLMANARCELQGFTLRTVDACGDRSICGMGPCCSWLRLRRCAVLGGTGLKVPLRKGTLTQLSLLDSTFSGIRHGLAAVHVEAGRLLMEGCTLTNNSVALEVGYQVVAEVRKCNISFNGTAIFNDGQLVLQGTHLWDNDQPGLAPGDAAAKRMPPPQSQSGRKRRASGAGNGLVASNEVDLQHPCPYRPLAPAEKHVESIIKQLQRQVYGAGDRDFDGWEILAMSDLSEVSSGEDYSYGSAGSVSSSDADLDEGSDDDDDEGDDDDDDDGEEQQNGLPLLSGGAGELLRNHQLEAEDWLDSSDGGSGDWREWAGEEEGSDPGDDDDSDKDDSDDIDDEEDTDSEDDDDDEEEEEEEE